MKKWMLTSCLFWFFFGAGLPVLGTQAEEPKSSKPVFLTVIVDTSPTAPAVKEQTGMAFHEVGKLLEPGDRIAVYTAHGGPPRLHLGWRIEAGTGRKTTILANCWRGIRFAALTKADVAQALQVALATLPDHDSEGTQVILVLGEAKFSDKQLRNIQNLLLQTQTNAAGISFLVSSQTTREILFSATQGHCEALVMGQIDWQNWFAKVRSRPHPNLSLDKTAAPPQENQPVPPQPVPLSPATSSGPSAPAPRTESLPLGREKFLLPVYPVLPESLEQTPFSPRPLAPESEPSRTVEPTAPPVLKDQGTSAKSLPSAPAARTVKDRLPSSPTLTPWLKAKGLWVGMAVGLFLLVILMVRSRIRRKNKPVASSCDSSVPTQRYRLIGLWDGSRFELGEEEGVRNVVLGRHPASPIPLDDPEIEPRHLRLTYKKGHIWIQNCSSHPIQLDGLPLAGRRKQKLLLPVQMQLTDKVRITLLREEIVLEDFPLTPESENSHENDQ